MRTAKPYTIGSPTAPGVTRTYTSWHQLTAENVDARVWSGLHTRTADTVGVTLGRQVAANALREAQRLFRWPTVRRKRCGRSRRSVSVLEGAVEEVEEGVAADQLERVRQETSEFCDI